MTDDPPKKSNRGGRRQGAGRKPRGYVPPTAVAGIDLKAVLGQAPPENIESAAAAHARTALETLVKQLTYGLSESAKVAAAKELLDRAYGKPAVDIGGEPTQPMLPFAAAPPSGAPASVEIRNEARKFANLAIATLRKIADSGSSESARVSAARALLDRGLGTVAQAKLPDEFGNRQLGKKEEASQAAKAAATGAYATPEGPRPKKESLN